MANKHLTLASLFTDIANAIRSKTGGSASIVADTFPTLIAALDTSGIDTSDATATAAKIASGYTAYVKGELIEGTAELDPFTPYNVIPNLYKPDGVIASGGLEIYGGEYIQVFCENTELGIFSDLLLSNDYKEGGTWFFDKNTGFFIQHQGTFGDYTLLGIYNTADNSNVYTTLTELNLSTNGPIQPTKYPNAIMDLFTDGDTKCFSNATAVQKDNSVVLTDNLFGSSYITITFADSASFSISIPENVHQAVYDNGLSIYIVVPDVVKAVMKNYDNFLNEISNYDDVRFYGKSMIGLHISTSMPTEITFNIDIDAEDTTAMDASRWYVLLTKNTLI